MIFHRSAEDLGSKIDDIPDFGQDIEDLSSRIDKIGEEISEEIPVMEQSIKELKAAVEIL